jgi:serine/threonine-protein kinase
MPVRFTLTLPPRVNSMLTVPGTSLAFSPDGQVIVCVGQVEGRTQLYRRPLDQLQAQAIPGTEEAQQPFFSPDGKWLGFIAAGRIKKVAVAGGPVLSIAAVPGLLFGASWGPDNVIVAALSTGLASVSADGGSLQLFARPKVGSAFVPMRWPLVLADGNTVVYSSWTGGLANGRVGVASRTTGRATVFDLSGTAPLGVVDGRLVYVSVGGAIMAVPFDVRHSRPSGAPVLATDGVYVGAIGGARAALSASGSLAYESGTSESQLVLVGADGRSRVVLEAPGQYAYPRFSPDGKRIALTITTLTAPAATDIWLYDLAAGTLTRLTADGSSDRPEWTPDGKRVLFRSERSYESSLWWQPADGSGPVEALLKVDGGPWEGVLAPDGRTLVYRTIRPGTGQDIWYVRLHGDRTPHPIATSSFNESHPRVSPDGRWVAYTSNESGRSQVYVRPFPGPGARVQVSTAGGIEPIWSPDGRRLYYRSGRALVAVTVTTAPSFGVASRQVLFEGDFVSTGPHPSYDVSPDGTQFLMLKPTGDEPQIVVVHDWLAELRARTAPKREN